MRAGMSMNLLCTAFAAALCLLCAPLQASVLEPENVGELMNSATLAFNETDFGWRRAESACPALDEAAGKGLRARELPRHLRGQGVMVLASCRVLASRQEQFPDGVAVDGAASVPVDRLLVVQDVSAPETVVLVFVASDGGWRYECFTHGAGEEAGAQPFLYWRVDCVERFPE